MRKWKHRTRRRKHSRQIKKRNCFTDAKQNMSEDCTVCHEIKKSASSKACCCIDGTKSTATGTSSRRKKYEDD